MPKINLSIANRRVSLDFNQHFSYLVKINESLRQGSSAYYQNLGLTYVDVPEIVGVTGACENIDTLFKVQNRLSLPLFFTQTGQLSLEQALQSFPGVFTVINSGRDEEIEDARHLRQFRLTEEEFDCRLAGLERLNFQEEKMYEILLRHIEGVVKSILKKVLADHRKILQKAYHRDIGQLRLAVHRPFFRVSYEEAVRILNKNGYPETRFGDDLKADHEAAIVKYFNKKQTEIPVFIMKYPKEIKFFNMQVSPHDPRLALSADLIFPYAGEGVGSAVREPDFKRLNERLIHSTMFRLHLRRGGTYRDFKWYLDIIKNKKTHPHAGYGLGNERVLQYLLAEKDIRRVSTFSLLNQQTGDWDKAHYGQAAMISPAKKHILLTIGQLKDKQFLLPYMMRMADKSHFVLYATAGTHRFLKDNGILTSRVYKIAEGGDGVNIANLLNRRIFDLVINIPRHRKKMDSTELTDGKLIRRSAVERGVSLITNREVAAVLMDNLVRCAY